MLNLTRPNFNAIKDKLLRQQRKAEEGLKALDKEDPVLDRGLIESSEPGTDSWLADTHARVVAMRRNLLDALANTKKALNNLRTGKYGTCEKCGKPIEPKRLEVVPTATLCISCSKKFAKK